MIACGLKDGIGAEWLKIRTVESTFYVLFTAVLFIPMSALLTWQTVAAWDGATVAERSGLAQSPPENGLLMLVQICLATLGVLAITPEYSTGMIRTTFTALPRRGVVLAAKSVVVGTVALLLGQVSVFAMFFLGRLVAGDRPIPIYVSAVSDEIPRLLSLGLSVMVVSLLGLGLGVITRSTAGGLTLLVALLFVFPTFGRLLPGPWNERFTAITLPRLPLQLAGEPGSYLSPPGAAVALAAYVVIALGLAALVLRTRDA